MAILFWVVAALIVIAVAAWMARPFLGARNAAPTRAAHDAAVYKSQLEEIARDQDRGVISAAEAEAARREIARRLIAADDEAARVEDIQTAPSGPARKGALVAAGLVVVVGLGAYLSIGAPGRPDEPLKLRDIASEKKATQLSQADAESFAPPDRAPDDPPQGLPPQFPDQVRQMEAILARQPEDARGLVILGNAYMQLERPRAAYAMLSRAADVLGDQVPPGLYVDIGRAMVAAAGGYVSQEAEAAFRRAPESPLSQILIGQAEAARGDLEQGLRRWAALYPQLPDPNLAAALLSQIRIIAEEMNLDVERVVERLQASRREAQGADSVVDEPTAPGPSREDMEAAAEMTPEERAAMVENMVAGLSERLQEDPNDLPGWLRLLRALQVLGRGDEALAAYQDATAAFDGNAEALAQLEAALDPALRERLQDGATPGESQ